VTPTSPGPPPGSFGFLVERIADGDRSALKALYLGLRESASENTRRALSRSEDVAAVVCGTFVEVWCLARFHRTADAGVRAWVISIAAVRTADLQRLALTRGPGPPPRSGIHESNRLTLEGLLGEPIRPHTRLVAGRRRLQASRDNDILW
jgi:hypothetical protein